MLVRWLQVSLDCQYITVGVLVMVSSELVVLLIVCVGINTGSTQQQQGETNYVTTSIQNTEYTHAGLGIDFLTTFKLHI